MAPAPRKQQKVDAQRIGTLSPGKLDTDKAPGRTPRMPPPAEPSRTATDVDLDTLRDRVRQDYDEAIRRLRDLGIAPDVDDAASRENGAPGVEEGDTAQANEQQEMSFATRQRLSERIKRLAGALERIESGTYGTCSVCGEPIERARLAAMPEADTCLRCQEELERSKGRRVA
jgi:DnaK suppressor protein